HHVAEIVYSEIESTQPDGHDQQSGAQPHRDLPAAAVDPENAEHIGEHAIADERAHRMAARKAPAEMRKENGGGGRPRRARETLEPRIEQPAPGEGREPAGEENPLTPRRKEETHR